MDCPVCRDVKLTMSDRQGIEIDYCPQCRGVWLDRGELDKLIERASAEAAPRASAPPAPPSPQYDPRQDPRHDPRHDPRAKYGHHQDGYTYKKKKNLLGELFDF